MRSIARLPTLAALFLMSAEQAIPLDLARAPCPSFKSATEGQSTIRPLEVLAETDPVANLTIESVSQQPSWRGRNYSLRAAPAGTTASPRPYRFVGNAITVDAPGSGLNGPANADYGQTVSVIKRGFPSSTATSGELDGLYLHGRQAGPTPTSLAGASDMNLLQLNGQIANWPGFLALIEAKGGRVNPTAPFAVSQEVSLQMATIDPFGKNGENGQPPYSSVDPLTSGYTALATVGKLDRAFAAYVSGGTIDDFAYFGQPGAPLFRVKGSDGSVVLGSDSASVKLGRDGTNRLTVQSTGGTAQQVQTVPGAWTPYTPTVTSALGAITTVGAVSAAYEQTGKTVRFRARVVITTNGTGAGSVNLSLPVTAPNSPVQIVAGAEDAVTGKMLKGKIGSSTVVLLTYDNVYPAANGAALIVSGTYEAL